MGAVYIGPLPPNRVRRHRAVQVLLSTSTPIVGDQGPRSQRHAAMSLIIPSFANHRISTHLFPAVSLYYEPTSTSLPRSVGILTKEISPAHLTQLRKLLANNFDSTSALDLLKVGAQIGNFNFAQQNRPQPKDSRISEIIDHLDEKMPLPPTIAMLSKHFNLSSSRLVHLFSDEMGMPFRSYLLWLRLRNTLHILADGRSLTEAAHEAGFSDSAHFSRVFSRTFGFSPSYLRVIQICKD